MLKIQKIKAANNSACNINYYLTIQKNQENRKEFFK